MRSSDDDLDQPEHEDDDAPGQLEAPGPVLVVRRLSVRTVSWPPAARGFLGDDRPVHLVDGHECPPRAFRHPGSGYTRIPVGCRFPEMSRRTGLASLRPAVWAAAPDVARCRGEPHDAPS